MDASGIKWLHKTKQMEMCAAMWCLTGFHVLMSCHSEIDSWSHDCLGQVQHWVGVESWNIMKFLLNCLLPDSDFAWQVQVFLGWLARSSGSEVDSHLLARFGVLVHTLSVSVGRCYKLVKLSLKCQTMLHALFILPTISRFSYEPPARPSEKVGLPGATCWTGSTSSNPVFDPIPSQQSYTLDIFGPSVSTVSF